MTDNRIRPWARGPAEVFRHADEGHYEAFAELGERIVARALDPKRGEELRTRRPVGNHRLEDRWSSGRHGRGDAARPSEGAAFSFVWDPIPVNRRAAIDRAYSDSSECGPGPPCAVVVTSRRMGSDQSVRSFDGGAGGACDPSRAQHVVPTRRAQHAPSGYSGRKV